MPIKLNAHIETEQSLTGEIISDKEKHVSISSIEVLKGEPGKDGYTPTEEELTTLINKQGFIKEFTETDPTVPPWAKQPNKPTYTASEVGALSSDTKLFSGNYNDLANKPSIPIVPSNVSAFTNDAGYITGYTETDPTVPPWAKQPNKPTYTASEVGALPASTELFSGDYNDLNNKPTIPTVPTNVSSFTNDAGYLTSFNEADPTVPGWAKQPNKPSYTASEVGALPDDTKLFSGNYNDLTNKPAIPTVPTNVSSFTNDAGYITSSQADATYAKKSDVPAAVTDDHINSLIDAKLGVIENGYY